MNLGLAGNKDTVDISAIAETVDVSSTLGNVVTRHDAVDLPLNGRNLTQLGLLQPGVAPLTFGILQSGGIARANQGYAVNGEPPESNSYLLDGVTNVDSVNCGFALRTPPDAVTEFRILLERAASARSSLRWQQGHASSFMLPENDIASPEFGQILQAAPPRLLQLALKFIF